MSSKVTPAEAVQAYLWGRDLDKLNTDPAMVEALADEAIRASAAHALARAVREFLGGPDPAAFERLSKAWDAYAEADHL